jgi:hypothetical protein
MAPEYLSGVVSCHSFFSVVAVFVPFSNAFLG